MNTTETFGRTIQIFLVDGTPNGLRKATIHGWTGPIFVAATSTFAALTSRKELDRTGIYILAGPDPDQVGGMRAYVGDNPLRIQIDNGRLSRTGLHRRPRGNGRYGGRLLPLARDPK